MPNKKEKKTVDNRPKPETERKLFSLQETFLASRNEDTKCEMFSLLVNYARSLTLKKNKGKVYIPPSRIDEIAVDSALATLEKYNDPNFRMFGSFAGYLNWKVLEGLYKPQNEDHTMSLNQKIDESSKSEFSDMSEKFRFIDIFTQRDSEQCEELSNPYHCEKLLSTVSEDIQEVINEMTESLDNAYESFITKLYLILFLRQPKDKESLARFQNFFIKDYALMKKIELTILEIRNRASLVS